MKLAIDPGHGMSNIVPGVYDPGAVASGVTESDIVMAWATTGVYLAKLRGVDTWLSRLEDTPAPLGIRDNRAKAAGCTHYLSLHCNAGVHTATGIEAYYRDGQDRLLAAAAVTAAVSALKLPNRGIRNETHTQHKRLSVLDFDGPATLLELGFITNARDRRALLDRDNRIAFWTMFFDSLQ